MQNKAENVDNEDKSGYNINSKELLSGASQPHKWRPTLKVPLVLSPPSLLTVVLYSPIEKDTLLAGCFN